MGRYVKDPWAKKAKAGQKRLDSMLSFGAGLASALVASTMSTSKKSTSSSSAIAQQRRIQREREKAYTLASNQEYARNYNEASEIIVNTISYMPSLEDPERISNAYSKLSSPKLYIKRPYPDSEPTMDEVVHTLEIRAREEISSILFWKNKARRQEYVEANKDHELEKAVKTWKLRKAEWDHDQDEREKKVNHEKLSEYEEKKSAMESYLHGGEEAICALFNKHIEKLELPYQISVSCAFMDELDALSIDVELPDIDVIPSEVAKVLASGKVSIKAKTIRDRNKEYVTSTLGVAYVLAAIGFNSGVAVDCVIVSAHINKYDEQTVTMKDEYIYAIAFGREEFGKAVSPKSSPLGGLLYFPHNIKMTKSYAFRKIDPTAIESLVLEMKEEDE